MEETSQNYTEEEFFFQLDAQLRQLITPSHLTPSSSPSAVLLGGQSSAGKTKLHDIFKKKFTEGAVVINGDEYRSFHPRYRELDAKYGIESVNHTAAWAGRMTEALIDAVSRLKYNLVIEGTLRTAEVPLKTARLLRGRGYCTSLALMAVKPEVSLISCQIRYEQMRIAGTVPRATDPAHHNKIVHDIVSNLAVLEDSGLFDQVSLFNRAGRCLYPKEGASERASEALRETLFGSWTVEEKSHYRFLQDRLEKLKRS